MVNESKKIENP